MGIAALAVAVLALLFTVGSFWWLYTRRGSLEVARPGTYAYAASTLRLRVPLAFYNTGARALIVSDLRVAVVDDSACPPLLWLAVVSKLLPDGRNARDYSTPFAVQGRATREVVAEFEGFWCPLLGTKHRMRLEAKLHPDDSWLDIVDFDWWAPPPGASMGQYITYRNAPPEEQ